MITAQLVSDAQVVSLRHGRWCLTLILLRFELVPSLPRLNPPYLTVVPQVNYVVPSTQFGYASIIRYRFLAR